MAIAESGVIAITVCIQVVRLLDLNENICVWLAFWFAAYRDETRLDDILYLFCG